MTASFDRPQHACVTCPPPRTESWTPAEHGSLICDRCFNRLEENLAEINTRYFQLDARPGGGQSDGRGSPGFGSKPPANLSVLVLRDHRSSSVAKVWVGADGRVHSEDESPALSIWSVLSTWATDVCELRSYEVRGNQPVHELCTWLTAQLDWIARQESVVEFFEDVSRLVRQLRPMTGDRRYPIGRCTQEFDGLDGEPYSCGARLYAPADGSVDDTIRCSACDAEWPRATWEEFARQQREAVA